MKAKKRRIEIRAETHEIKIIRFRIDRTASLSLQVLDKEKERFKELDRNKEKIDDNNNF